MKNSKSNFINYKKKIEKKSDSEVSCVNGTLEAADQKEKVQAVNHQKRCGHAKDQ